jgi:hypothetical protein
VMTARFGSVRPIRSAHGDSRRLQVRPVSQVTAGRVSKVYPVIHGEIAFPLVEDRSRRFFGARMLSPVEEETARPEDFVVSRFEDPAQFGTAYPNMAPSRSALKTALLSAGLLAYAAGFVILYPIVESSVMKSVSQGNDPALLQFVGP